MSFDRKDLIDIASLSRQEIEFLMAASDRFLRNPERSEGSQTEILRYAQNDRDLHGKTICNLFFEDSTRTRVSFEIAAKRLSADVVNVFADGSSASKGETLLDTAKNLEAMGTDLIVVRHPEPGMPQMLADNLQCHVVNAGDGIQGHPSQALLDLKTLLLHKPNLEGVVVAIVGDVAHSRVARSNIECLQKFGATLRVVGPKEWIPEDIVNAGVEKAHDLASGIGDADVVMMLRIKHEYMEGLPFESLDSYVAEFGLHAGTQKYLRKDALVVHQGPINRGVELSDEIADGPQSVILEQVKVGVAVRMAILSELLKEKA